MVSNPGGVEKQQGPWRKAELLSDLKPGVLLLETHRNCDPSALTSPYLDSLVCTVGMIRPALYISLNHCEEGQSSQ